MIYYVNEYQDPIFYINSFNINQVPGRLGYFFDFSVLSMYERTISDADTAYEACFPSFGSSLLFNLGRPFDIVIENNRQTINTAVWLPRIFQSTMIVSSDVRYYCLRASVNLFHSNLNLHHASANRYVVPINCLSIKHYPSSILEINEWVLDIIEKTNRSSGEAEAVSDALRFMEKHLKAGLHSELLAKSCFKTTKTLNRYFLKYTGLPIKQVFNRIRIKQAIKEWICNPEEFDYESWGYYDKSHFHKEVFNICKLKPNQLCNIKETKSHPWKAFNVI